MIQGENVMKKKVIAILAVCFIFGGIRALGIGAVGETELCSNPTVIEIVQLALRMELQDY